MMKFRIILLLLFIIVLINGCKSSLENSREQICEIKELDSYPEELSLVYLDSKLSDDCMMQNDEREILNKTMMLFHYDSLIQIKERVLEMNGLNTLLEIFYDYNLYNESKEVYYDLEENEIIYLKSIVHILWIEDKNMFPWSIKNYSKEDINYLIEREDDSQWSDGEISREYTKLFPLSVNLVNDSKEKTIRNIIEWEMKNFFHASEQYGWGVYSKKSDEITSIPLESVFKERVVDCHLASHILIGMLRSINIPAYEKNYRGHGVTFIPDLNLYVHGDYIAQFSVNPDILMTKEELEIYVNSEEGYNKFWNENQNKYPLLKRKGNNLYIEGTLQTQEAKSEENINFIKESLKEYNLTFHGNELGGIEIKSDLIKINEL